VVPVVEESRKRTRRALPIVLALSMLAVVVAAGLLPATGVVSAASSCTYGSCPAAKPFPYWAVGASVAVVIVALIAALLLLRRSRRRPPAGGSTPPAGSSGPTGESGGYGGGSPGSGPSSEDGSYSPESEVPSADETT
jgi:uncharacterized membrane protein YgcG